MFKTMYEMLLVALVAVGLLGMVVNLYILASKMLFEFSQFLSGQFTYSSLLVRTGILALVFVVAAILLSISSGDAED